MTAATVEPFEQPRLRVTARRIPDAEPPYDDTPPLRVVRGAMALAPYVHRPPAPAPLRLVPEPDLDDDGAFDAVRTPREDLEDPRPRAAMLCRAVLETLSGDRPAGQLMRWVTPEVFAEFEPLVASQRGRGPVATLRRVLVSEPVPGVAEVTAVVQRGIRAGALALRLEGVDGRWLVTALQFG